MDLYKFRLAIEGFMYGFGITLGFALAFYITSMFIC